MIKLFLVIFRSVKRFFKIFLKLFFLSIPDFIQSTKSSDQSTWLEVGRPGRSTDVHRIVHVWQTLDGRPSGSTRLRAELSVRLGGPGRSTGSSQRAKFDRWAVDRAVDQQRYFGKICCQRLVSRFAYKYPICKSFSLRFLVRIFPYSLVFLLKSKEVFELYLNNIFGVFARIWKFKEKGFWEKIQLERSHLVFYYFSRIFFVIFYFHSIGFLHT